MLSASLNKTFPSFLPSFRYRGTNPRPSSLKRESLTNAPMSSVETTIWICCLWKLVDIERKKTRGCVQRTDYTPAYTSRCRERLSVVQGLMGSSHASGYKIRKQVMRLVVVLNILLTRRGQIKANCLLPARSSLHLHQ